MSMTDELLSNNQAYSEDFTGGDLPAPPSRRLAVVACMDARIDVYRLLGLRRGEAHVIRNAGGVVTEDVVRSLLLSQRLLGTEEVVLIHHTDCGLATFKDDEVKAQIYAETGLRPPFALEAFPEVDGAVRQSMARLRASPFVPRQDGIRGFVYEVETGRLREITG